MRAAVRTKRRDCHRPGLDGVSRQELQTFRDEGEHVPRIIVMPDGASHAVMLSGRIGVADLDSEHFRAQLSQRVSWTADEAHSAEQAAA